MRKVLSALMVLTLMMTSGFVFAEEEKQEKPQIVEKMGEAEELYDLLENFVEQPYEVWKVILTEQSIVKLPLERTDVVAVYVLDGRSMNKAEYKVVEGGIEITAHVGLYIVQFKKENKVEIKPIETVKPTEVVKATETTKAEPKKDKVPKTGAYR